MLKKNFIYLLLLFFTACSVHHVEKTHPRTLYILMKSDFLKVNNQAFLYKDKMGLEAEFYDLGRPFLKLQIGKKICINKNCYLKTSFNKKFFKAKYYPNLIEDIMTFKPIFSAKGYIGTNCGFKQDLGNILYEVCGGKMKFEDIKTGLKIKINENKRKNLRSF